MKEPKEKTRKPLKMTFLLEDGQIHFVIVSDYGTVNIRGYDFFIVDCSETPLVTEKGDVLMYEPPNDHKFIISHVETGMKASSANFLHLAIEELERKMDKYPNFYEKATETCRKNGVETPVNVLV